MKQKKQESTIHNIYLPQEIFLEIFKWTDDEDNYKTMKSFRMMNTLFYNKLKDLYYLKAGKKALISYDLKNLSKIVKKDPAFLLHKLTFTDHTLRKFTNTTVFQYALWSLDTRYLARVLIDAISEIPPEDKNRQNVIGGLLVQYNELESSGVSYSLEGKIYEEKHINFLLTEDKTLGVHQKLWPMHLILQYRNNLALSYWEDKFTAPLEAYLKNLLHYQKEWMEAQKEIKEKNSDAWAAICGGFSINVARQVSITPTWMRECRNNISLFYDKRIEDFKNLKIELETLNSTAENTPSVNGVSL